MRRVVLERAISSRNRYNKKKFYILNYLNFPMENQATYLLLCRYNQL
jgi:hypothetical protein